MPRPIDDAVEACADALLTTAAASLPMPANPAKALEVAWEALLVVLERSTREGPKPR